MAKDPAVLFYTSDFLSGTMTMTDEQVGKYIRLLCLQHQKGFLTEKDMNYICRTYDEDVYSKFVMEDGKFYNARMRDEAEKRKKYSESRKKNISKRYDTTYEPTHVDTYVEHMENENKDINTNKDLALDLSGEFETIWKQYPNRQGKKNAERHFKASVKNESALSDIKKALENYLKCGRVKSGYIQNGSTWFNDWQSWVNPTEQMMGANNGTGINGNRQSDATKRATFRHTEQQIKDLEAFGETLRQRYPERG